MKGHAEKCFERYCALATTSVSSLQQVATPCIDNHSIPPEEYETTGELPAVCAQRVLTCLYLARIGRPDLLWFVNTLTRSVTTWNKACDKRLLRLIPANIPNSSHPIQLYLLEDNAAVIQMINEGQSPKFKARHPIAPS